MLKNENKTLSQLSSCMQHYPQELHALEVSDKPDIQTVPEIAEAIKLAEAGLGDRGRVLVRYSGTEKKIRVLVEAQDADAAKTYADSICEAIQATIGLLSHV